MVFVSVLALEMEQVNVRILNHQEMIKNGEAYCWPAFLSYHVGWLQHLEQGQAMWDDGATKLKLHLALVWHWVMQPAKIPLAILQASKQKSAINKVQRKTGPFSDPSEPGDKTCTGF